MLHPARFKSNIHRELLKDRRVREEVSTPTKEQVLASGKLFIKFRWIAVVALAAAGGLASGLGFPVSFHAVLGLSGLLLLGNLLFRSMALRIGRSIESVSGRMLQSFNLGQVVLDWGVLFMLVHWTGGVESPTVYFFFVHLVMTAILQPMWQVNLMAALGVLVISGLFHLEAFELIPHHCLVSDPGNRHMDLHYIWSITAVLAASSVSLVMLTRWVAALVRRRMVELAAVKVSLEDANRKRQAIVATIKSLGEAQELETLLERAVTEARNLWGISGAAIGLWSDEDQSFSLAAVSGLDAPEGLDPLDHINRMERVEGLGKTDATIIPDVREEPGLAGTQMELWLTRYSQQSAMVMPLHVGQNLVGLFLLTCDRVNRFGPDEVSHFRVFCDLLSAGIESARAHRLLLEHSRSRNWFFHRVAHDLRSPVGAMRSMLTLVEEGYVTDEKEIRGLVTRVNQRAVLLESLVNDLLILAENRMKGPAVETEPIDIIAILNEICAMFKNEADRKGVEFTSPQPEPPRAIIRGNRQSVERVLNNLLSNAVKYTRKGGKVTVVTRTLDSRIQILVSDTGIGIPVESQGKLFEEFFRAPNARELTPVGTGLGLRITRNLVEEMGGNLRFTSMENEGSTFAVTMPMDLSPAEPRKPE